MFADAGCRTLQKMYSSDYLAVNKKASEADSPKDPGFVLRFLKERGRTGLFLDYGCGEGDLLLTTRALGLGLRWF